MMKNVLAISAGNTCKDVLGLHTTKSSSCHHMPEEATHIKCRGQFHVVRLFSKCCTLFGVTRMLAGR